jgi:anaerobic selenocysteine-containing dehydrogenase
MDQSRRKFFGIGAAVAAAAAIPAGAIVAKKASDEAVGPMMFEHVCDHGASRYTPEYVNESQKDAPWRYRGCGTRFRWWFGVPPICPSCGWHYILTLEDIKTHFYKRVQ